MARVLPIRQKQFRRLSQLSISLTDKALQSMRQQQESVKCHDKLKQLINHQAYNLSMALLTIYSIFAIDIEKAGGFGQASAYIFGYIHIIAIVIFIIQMTLNSIGKQGYKASFYFWIDLISTISMSMEITWVDNYLAANSNLPGVLTIAKVVKASRLSRIGSRAAKIIFIFLQYLKNKKQEEQKIRKLQNKMTESAAGELRTQTVAESRNRDEIDNILEQEAFHQQIVNQLPKKFDYKKNGLQPIQEEKISQKSEFEQKIQSLAQKSSLCRSKQNLSQPNYLMGNINRRDRYKGRSKQKFTSSYKRTEKINFQISNIVQALEKCFPLTPLDRPKVDPKQKQQIQRQWQQICERELQANKQQKQKIKSDKQNFKLGQALKQRIQKNIIIMIMSLIIILPLISADTWLNKDPTIDQLMQNYIQFAATLDDKAAQLFLKDLVITANSGTYPVLDLKMETNTTVLQYPGNILPKLDNSPPVSDFMQVQMINTSSTDFTLIFNARNIDQITSQMNIARSCFITILLIFSTIIFMHSIESKALIPLENMCKSINKISVNPFDALKEVNQKDQNQGQKTEKNQGRQQKIDKNDLQTNMLQRTIWKMTKIVALGAGETGSQLISTKIDFLNSDTNIVEDEEYKKIHGVFLAINISNFEQIFRKNQQNLLFFINFITKNLHQIATATAGTILQSNPPNFLFFWKTPQDPHVQHKNTKFFVANNPLKNQGKTVQTQKIIQIVLRSYLKMSMSLIDIIKKRFQELKRLNDENLEDQYEFFALRAGVHLGGAYQAPVGNKYKIQVRSIGDNVDFVKKLASLAEKYNLSNMVSNEIYDILEESPQNYMRKVDCIKEMNWVNQFWLYTFDFTLMPFIEPNQFKLNRKKKDKSQLKIQRIFRNYRDKTFVYNKRSEILSKINSEHIDGILPFTSLQKICFKPYNLAFYTNWNQAIDSYYESQWEFAIDIFQKINQKLQPGYKDPICVLYLDRIQKKGGEAPMEWQKFVQLEQSQLL